MDLSELARNLLIEPVPDVWEVPYNNYLKWSDAKHCGYRAESMPTNAVDVFDLPPDSIAAIYEICGHIQRDEYLRKLADFWHYLLYHLPGGRGLDESVFPKLTNYLGPRASLFPVAVICSGSDHAIEAFRSRNVSDTVAFDTLSQLGFYMRDHLERYGCYGVSYTGWLRNHLRAEIFRLGRLIYNVTTFSWPFRVYTNQSTDQILTLCEEGLPMRSDGLADGTNSVFDPDAWTTRFFDDVDTATGNPVSLMGEAVREPVSLAKDKWREVFVKGQDMIDVHIPGRGAGGKLNMEECCRSYEQAMGFFTATFPDRDFKGFVCYSWLLDPNLALILPDKSNIVQFQSTYQRLPMIGSEHQAYDLVFNLDTLDLTNAPRTTFLQRAIIDYVNKGHQLRSAAGFMTKVECLALIGSYK